MEVDYSGAVQAARETKMLEKGTQAPDFELQDQDGRRHTLKVLLGDGPLILYFYRPTSRRVAPRRPAASATCTRN